MVYSKLEMHIAPENNKNSSLYMTAFIKCFIKQIAELGPSIYSLVNFLLHISSLYKNICMACK